MAQDYGRGPCCRDVSRGQVQLALLGQPDARHCDQCAAAPRRRERDRAAALEPRCICGPDATGEGPDFRPDCPACNRPIDLTPTETAPY